MDSDEKNENQRVRKTKTKNVVTFSIFFLLIGLVLGSSVDAYVEGDLWSLNDDTIVLSNSSHNVNIGENATTTYRLSVNGTSYFNDTIHATTLNFDNDFDISRQDYNGNFLEFSIDDNTNRFVSFKNNGIGKLGLLTELFRLYHPTATLFIDSDESGGSGMSGIRFDTLTDFWLISNENVNGNDFVIRDTDASLDCLEIENDVGNVLMNYDLQVTDNCIIGDTLSVNTDSNAETTVDIKGTLFIRSGVIDYPTSGTGIFMYSALGNYIKSALFSSGAISSYRPLNMYADDYKFYVGSRTSTLTSLQMILMNIGSEVGYLGVGDTFPSYRVELPNTASASGQGRANSWIRYSDMRAKEFLWNGIPKVATIKFCENVSDMILMYHPISTNQNETTGVVEFGETDYDNLSVGIPAQYLYQYVKNNFGEYFADSIVYKPVDESVDYWSVDYNIIDLMFSKLSGYILEDTQENKRHIQHMEDFMSNYGYTPLEWN